MSCRWDGRHNFNSVILKCFSLLRTNNIPHNTHLLALQEKSAWDPCKSNQESGGPSLPLTLACLSRQAFRWLRKSTFRQAAHSKGTTMASSISRLLFLSCLSLPVLAFLPSVPPDLHFPVLLAAVH